MRQFPALVLAAIAGWATLASADPGDPRATAPDAEAGRARVFAPTIASAGEWRAGLSLGYFSSESFPRPGVAHAQSAGRLALAAALADELEAFVQVGLVANRNEGTVPKLIQAVGDLTLGAKWARPFGEVFRGGVVGLLQLPAGTGSVSLAPEALGAMAALLGAAHTTIEGGGEPWAIALSAQLGAQVDNSEALLPKTRRPTIVQEYSLGVSSYPRFQAGVLATAGRSAYAGYLEFHVDAPVGVPDDALRLATSGERVRYATVVAWRLTPGVRIAPVRGLTLDAGLELGFGNNVVRGFASAPPWALRVGATFAFDPVRAASAPEPPPEPVLPPPPPLPPEPALPPTGWIEGRVALADGAPVEGAVVSFSGERGPPVASDANGRFRSYALAPGPVALIARKAGFSPGTATVEIARGQAVGAALTLEPKPPPPPPPPPPPSGTIAVRICDESGAPIAGSLRITGPATRGFVVDADGVTMRELPPGRYQLVAWGERRLARARTIELAADAVVPVEACVVAAPKKPAFEVTGNAVVLRGLAFAKNGALPASAGATIEALADVLLRRDALAFVRVEAHVDASAGKPATLDLLTKAQADAIARALAERGVAGAEAIGKGAREPAGKGRGAKAANTRVVVTFGP